MGEAIVRVYRYGPGDEAIQWPCDAGCDHGMLHAPARFCPKCGGAGVLVEWIREDSDG
jgi:rRNA maturation endonuclease Nob1